MVEMLFYVNRNTLPHGKDDWGSMTCRINLTEKFVESVAVLALYENITAAAAVDLMAPDDEGFSWGARSDLRQHVHMRLMELLK